MVNYYWIDALAPLVFRSGKPFGAQSDTEDIIFPLPSAAAGLMRAVSAQQQTDFTGEFDSENLKQIRTNGLFLAQKDGSGNLKIFAPKPAHAVYLKNKETGQINIICLSPTEINNPDDCGCDLPHNDLLPLKMDGDHKGKPQSGKQFWLLSDYLAWLNGENISFEQVEKNGVTLSAIEVRTHIAINDTTGTNQDGLFFQTAAYDFAPAQKANHQGWENSKLGFVIACECALKDDLVRFGGEGRLSYLCQTELTENPFRLPEICGNRIKLTLLTPAIFAQGWLPKWLNKEENLTGKLPHTNLNVQLKAAAIERWLPVSGWDLATGKPKPMRKAVPAGATYWLEIQNQDVDIQSELQKLAYQSVCDDEQDQRDGFGIVAVSEWK